MPDQEPATAPADQAKLPDPIPPGQLEIIPGNTRLLLIAPHGYPDDENPKDGEHGTADIVRRVQEVLGYCAIINETNPKTKRNLNSIKGVKDFPEYTEAIRKFVGGDDHTLVVFVHGATDKKIKAEASDLKIKGDLAAVIGYGQPDEANYCARKETAEAFVKAMSDNGLLSSEAFTKPKNRKGLCAAGNDTMTQWFKKNGLGNFNKVEVIQIEFKDTGLRSSPEQCAETAKKLAEALKALLPPVPAVNEATPEPLVPEIVDEQSEDELVEETYAWLQSRFKEHIIDFTVEAGHRIINAFYGGDYEKARLKKKVKGKALRKLIQKLQSQASNAPSKTWVYDAVNLAIDDHSYGGDENFRAHGNLGPIQAYRALSHNQRLRLAYVKDPEIKEKLITETAEHNYNDRDLRRRIAEEKRKLAGKAPKSLPQLKDLPPLDLDHLPGKAVLKEQDPEKLRALFDLVKSKIDEGQKDFQKYRRALYNLGLVLAEKTGDFIEGEGRFQEWTKENINICSGCKNDCLYCYMKPTGVWLNTLKAPEDWRNWQLEQKKVNQERKLREGRVGFPSTHDIFPEILDAYLEVLGKVLRAGNDVLIVSKPRRDCIEAICSACVFFKDKILFRFTIGANDNDILRYWEPNAPTYEERKECLAYAHENKFRTSVSVEPMLDTPRIEKLVADLGPLVNEFIWLGMMSHLGRLKNWSNAEGFDKRKAIIEAGQTPEMLTAIYDAFRDNPKVKFKTETLKVIFEHMKQVGRIKGDMTVEAGKLVPGETQ